MEMGRYRRKTAHATWNEQELQAAIDAVNNGKSIRGSAAMYKIPESSLRRRLKARRLSAPMGTSTIFTVEQEKLFADYLINLSNTFFGLTAIQCRRIAYEVAEIMKVNHKFNRNERLAGKEWFQGFLKRNPQFSVQKPYISTTSTNEIRDCNTDEVGKYFHNLQLLMSQYQFSPNRMYNANDTGIFTVQETQNILDLTGDKRFPSESM